MTKRFKTSYFVLVKNEAGQYDHYDEIVLKKTVTDRMEQRDSWKIMYAKNWFQNKIREDYWKGFTVHTRNITEI